MMQDLLQWSRDNEPDESLLWKQGYWDQIMFVRDVLGSKLKRDLLVISTHTSKSIKLPVYLIIGTKFDVVARYNFHDWKVSVKRYQTATPDRFDVAGLVHDPTAKVPACYCEGFEPDWVYNSFSESSTQFTAELHDKYQLYTLVDRLIVNS